MMCFKCKQIRSFRIHRSWRYESVVHWNGEQGNDEYDPCDDNSGDKSASLSISMNPCFDTPFQNHQQTFTVEGRVGYTLGVWLGAGSSDSVQLGCGVELGIQICVSGNYQEIKITFKGWLEAACSLSVGGGSLFSAYVRVETTIEVGYGLQNKQFSFKWMGAIEIGRGHHCSSHRTYIYVYFSLVNSSLCFISRLRHQLEKRMFTSVGPS